MVEDPGLLAMFGAALGLVPPWQVTSVIFDKEAGKLEIGLDFPRGSRFACPIEGCRESACPVHDTAEKTWRHLDFFEPQAFLAARVPRVWRRWPESTTPGSGGWSNTTSRRSSARGPHAKGRGLEPRVVARVCGGGEVRSRMVRWCSTRSSGRRRFGGWVGRQRRRRVLLL